MSKSKLKSALVQAGTIAAIALAATQAQAACTFGSASSGEPSLQSVFNSLLGPSGATNAVNACVNDGADVGWELDGTVGAIDIVLELAGNANTNSFGVYDLADPTRRLTVFEGNDRASATATLRVRADGRGGWQLSVREINNPDDPSGWTSLNSMRTTAFGFYLATASNGIFYSDTTRNADHIDHLYAYGGNGATFASGPLSGTVFSASDFLLAWEDLAGGGDRDYQDFVVVAQDIAPVPLPTAVSLLASALIGLAGVSRRRL
jgi:type IV secretory pathway VirB2 component (pilin)